MYANGIGKIYFQSSGNPLTVFDLIVINKDEIGAILRDLESTPGTSSPWPVTAFTFKRQVLDDFDNDDDKDKDIDDD